MYQQITIIGNLGRDPESKQAKNGRTYANFSVAASRSLGQGQKETAWFSCSAWEKTGQYVCQYAQKGSLVMVVGRLAFDAQTGGPRMWADQQGNARCNFEVSVDKVQILSGFKDADQRNQTPAYGTKPEPQPQQESFEQYY